MNVKYPGRIADVTVIGPYHRSVRPDVVGGQGRHSRSRPAFEHTSGNLNQGAELMSTSCAGAPRGATTTSIRHKARALWLAGAMLAASSCVASLAVLPAAAQARHETGSQRAASVLTGLSSTPHTAISAFCAHFPVSTVSSIVGAKEYVFETVIENSTYECIFLGTTAKGWEVIISRKTGIPPAELATLKAAEARLTAASPKGADRNFHCTTVRRQDGVQLDLRALVERGPARRRRGQQGDHRLRRRHGPRGEDLWHRGIARARPRAPADAGHGCLNSGLGH